MSEASRICHKCNGDLDGCWLTWKGEDYCSDCWAEMKDAPKMRCITPEELKE